MRYFLIFFYFLAILIYPGCDEQSKKEGVISDFENILLPEQIHVLDSVVTDHEKETSNEVAIVSLSIDTSKIKDIQGVSKLTLDYANKLEVGKKGVNNGVCIIFSVKAKMIRIEVGYGLETKLTNSEAQQIIESIIIPRFKKGDYFQAVLEGLQAVIKEIK